MAKEKVIAESLREATLRSKILKNVPPKVAAANNNAIRTNCDKDYYENINKQLEIKLKERDSTIAKLNNDIEKLNAEVLYNKRQNLNGVDVFNILNLKLFEVLSCIPFFLAN